MTICFIGAFLLFSFPAHAAPKNFDLLSTGGVGGWLNVTRPLTAADMEGRLVLLDFWTYGCINCMQIVPDLSALEEKFGDKLLIIGVHSAKFQAEQGNDRILAAAQRFGLKHPVINDSDYGIWSAFGVHAWPTQVLLGPDGAEIARYEGEGHRAEIERDIVAHLPTHAVASANLVAPDDSQSVLSFPARLARHGDLLFVADSGHNRIVGFDGQGKIKITIGSGEQGSKDGAFTAAQFNHPRGIAFLGDDLYIADTGNHKIRRADLAAQTVETAAGTGERGTDHDVRQVPALSAALASPWDIEKLDDNTLAIAVAGLHQLWIYDAAGKTVSALAGTGRESIADGNPHTSAALAQPSGLSRGADGNLYFVDAESSALRVLKKAGVKTLIGTGLFDFGFTDGTYPKAMMQHPQGLFAEQDRIIVADTYNNALRVYDLLTKELSTLKLTGEALSEPGDVLAEGNTLWIADTNHHAIRKADLKTGAVSDVPLSP